MDDLVVIALVACGAGFAAGFLFAQVPKHPDQDAFPQDEVVEDVTACEPDRRRFYVRGADHPWEACQAAGVPRLGDPHPDHAGVADQVAANPAGGGRYLVTVEYREGR